MKHFKTAWQHMRRSPYQALSAILVMALTFFISATLVLVALGSQVVLQWFETRPQVTAFFKDGTKIEQIEDLKGKLSQTGKVGNMKYVSKEEALVIYKDLTKGEPLLQEMVTANLLPASLEVSAKELNILGQMAEILKKEEIVEEVIFPEDVVSSLSSLTSALRKIGLSLILFIAVISLLEILVMISLKITLRKEEIEILRLIGASSWQIRLPFILEGIFYGVGGALMGWLGTSLLLLYSTPFLVSYLAEIPLFPVSPIYLLLLLGGMIIGGVLIGATGSFLAVRRYLR